MKIQDLLLIAVFIILFFLKKPRVTLGVALSFLAISAVLFQLWIFFTAQRLVIYAFFLLFLTLFQIMINYKHEHN